MQRIVSANALLLKIFEQDSLGRARWCCSADHFATSAGQPKPGRAARSHCPELQDRGPERKRWVLIMKADRRLLAFRNLKSLCPTPLHTILAFRQRVHVGYCKSHCKHLTRTPIGFSWDDRNLPSFQTWQASQPRPIGTSGMQGELHDFTPVRSTNQNEEFEGLQG